LFLGRRAQRFEESADRFVASETTKWVRDSLRAVIDRAKKMEIPLAIFSSSPRFLVQRVAHTLEIPHVYATDYSIDSTGCFSGLGELMDAHAKCKHLQTLTSSLGISRGDVMTFSDDLIDLPFLEAGGRVCVVDPARKLRKLASARGWVAIDE
ncbi:MAG: haloacid dehalogenase-like hydrolase, partial [Chlamydiia bacterium]|nr:haloacid dehalogenase-like hydrolase [Chlamydiia bacterium]